MTYVVTENCIQCKHTECVDICPADAFKEGDIFMVIDPDECVDCGLCVPECPEEAIFAESDLDPADNKYIDINADLSRVWPVILEPREPLADFAQWSGKPDRFKLLEPLVETAEAV